MGETATCESCGMPIETGRYCSYCTDDAGELQSFDERFSRMVEWEMRRQPGADRSEVESATRAYMATMPAWRDHPRLSGRAD
ncbi:MAG TPA: zinc ribbon domain-containing protein [Acidimicrobiales bacterium]|nr:zinc ribbon domain-containing protein [Acidimicrobiales bacterium]